MKRLYEVTIRVYVMAESREEAQTRAVADCLNDDAEAREASGVDSGWWDWFPLGGDNDRTCGEILQVQRQRVSP